MLFQHPLRSLALAALLFGLPSATAQPSPCVTARLVGPTRTLGPTGQDLALYLMEISTQRCNGQQLVRVMTRNGGRIPPLGYWRMGSGFPTTLRYWVMTGARVEYRTAPNVWKGVDIQRKTW